jgi:hypothetical protein
VATKKPASTVPLPFRTEKGEVTNYVSNFKVAQKAPAVKQAKPAPPPKPAYDSFLDLAWERLDTIKSKPAEEAKPKSEPPKPAPAVQEKVKTSVRSPSPEVVFIIVNYSMKNHMNGLIFKASLISSKRLPTGWVTKMKWKN